MIAIKSKSSNVLGLNGGHVEGNGVLNILNNYLFTLQVEEI